MKEEKLNTFEIEFDEYILKREEKQKENDKV